MNKNLQNIENLFRDGLEDNEEIPSQLVWKSIDNMLDKDKVVRIKKKYSSLIRVAILLLFLLLGLSIYELTNKHNTNNLPKQNNKQGENKEVIPKDNSAGSSANIIDPKRLNDTVSINKYDQKNIATNNSADDKSSPDNHLIIQPLNNSISKMKTIVVSGYKMNIKSPDSVKEIEEVIIDNNDTEMGKQMQVLQQNPIAIKKRDYLQKDSVNTKKFMQPVSGDKIIADIDAKNIVATNKKIKTGNPFFLSIGLFFSPDIAFYHLLADKPDNQPDNATRIEKGEHHEFSSTSGLLVDHKLNKYFALETGLILSNINITINPKIIYAQPDNTGNIKYRLNISSGYGYLIPTFQNSPAIGDSLFVSAITHKLRYIGIPVAVKFKTRKGKFSFETRAGVSVNHLTKGKLETEIRRGINSEIDILDNIRGLRSTYFSGVLGAGIAYNLFKKTAITFSPAIRFAITSINNGAVVKSFPSSFGLSIGIKKNF